MRPASRPITSTTYVRSWDVAVSRILLMLSTAVFTAVSNPMVASGEGDIVVDGGGNAYSGHTLLVQRQGPPQRSVRLR